MRYVLLLLVLLAACSVSSPSGRVVSGDELILSANESAQASFERELRAFGESPNKRSMYEKYIGQIGANGLLDGVERVFSECHGQAHDIGKVVFARTKSVGESLKVCAQRCYSGCMHGVLMEAFKDEGVGDEEGHIDVDKLKNKLNGLCFEDEAMAEYGPGECAHGVGHTLMFLSGYRVQSALDACGGFESEAMEYYCADGAYMEYLTASVWDDSGKSQFYPCDVFKYPAACMRTKVGLAAKEWYDAGDDYKRVIDECKLLNGSIRFGCFHGLGTSHSRFLVRGDLSIIDLCAQGGESDALACVEGALEFIGKYWSNKHPRICAPLETTDVVLHKKCVEAGEGGLYRLDKNLSQYVS